MRRREILALPLLAARPSPAASPLTSTLEELVAEGAVVGAQAVYGQGAEASEIAIGLVEPGGARKVGAATQFCVGSVSKPLASAAIVGLADEGKLDLDAKADAYLPAYSHLRLASGESAEAPTLRQLLAHRGGVYSQHAGPMRPSQKRWIRDFRLTLAEAVEGIAGEPLASAPGSAYAYSGAGYCVLGAAAAAAVGEPFEQILRRRVVEPLALERTGYFPDPAEKDIAAGADPRTGKPHPETPHLLGAELRLALVGGSVYSTAGELARFARMALAKGAAPGGRRALSERAWREWTRQPFPEQPYGHGWGLLLDASGRVRRLRHNGALAASRAILQADLDSGGYAAVTYTVAKLNGEAEKRLGAAVTRTLDYL
ncbi:MAG: serine hydrolase [Acidobacteria bacterium]|nr:serine hydrolase [Acidobacteriota bacterium]